MSLMQPIGQKRLTNIAVVRLKRHGQRFEVACYKNKVISWRNGVEKDIDEVLQTHTVFSNVGKGQLAKGKDLKAAFGTDDEDVVCRQILDHGEFQVSDKERENLTSSQLRDITSIVMEKTINPAAQRPYTMGMIERFIKEVHFSVDPNRSSKQQALELIRELESRFPISRARMELRLTLPAGQKGLLEAQLTSWKALVQSLHEAGGQYSVLYQVDPGHYRLCDKFASENTGRLEVVSMSVQKEGDTTFDAYDEENQQQGKSLKTQGADRSKAQSLMEEANLADKFSKIGVSKAAFASEQTRGPQGERPAEEKGFAKEPAVLGAGAGTATASKGGKQMRCNTCAADCGEAKEYREHFKSEWHKHNLKRKLVNLTPLSAQECEADTDIVEVKSDLDQYSR